MQAVIDEQGRVEIPQELLDRLNLATGAVVHVEAIENELHIRAATHHPDPTNNKGELVWKDGLLMFSRPRQVVTVDDVNDAIENVRNERIRHIMGEEIEGG